jgi:hypothetical protein
MSCDWGKFVVDRYVLVPAGLMGPRPSRDQGKVKGRFVTYPSQLELMFTDLPRSMNSEQTLRYIRIASLTLCPSPAFLPLGIG